MNDKEYEKLLDSMSDAQLAAELRRCNRQTFYGGKPSLRDVAEITPLEIIFETYRKGKRP